MAKRSGIRIDEKEEQVVRSRTGAERIERVAPRFKSGKLLLLEKRFRRIRIVSPERHTDDFFSRRDLRRARAFALRAHPLRAQPPADFIDFRPPLTSPHD